MGHKNRSKTNTKYKPLILISTFSHLSLSDVWMNLFQVPVSQNKITGRKVCATFDPVSQTLVLNLFADLIYPYKLHIFSFFTCRRYIYVLTHLLFKFNLQEEIDSRPRVSTFISSIVNYSNTIPAATDPDAKPPAPSARMGKLNCCISLDTGATLTFRFYFLVFRNADRCILALHSKHFRCHPIYPFNVGRWYGWRNLWLSDCFDLLLCGMYIAW